MTMNANKSTSRRQGRLREEGSEGSPMAKVRADGQKPHTRLSPWASWHNITKPEGLWGRVNAAVAHGKLTFLSGEIRTLCDRSVMRNIRNRFNRLTKYPAYPFTVNGYESLHEGNTKQTASHDQPCGAPHGNMRSKRAEVSRGHSSHDRRRPERGKE